MKILLIEDEEQKRLAIEEQVRLCVGDTLKMVECESLRGGLKEVIKGGFDLILLDMSMPGFDSGDSDAAFEDPESFAGKEILAQMSLRNIMIPVVVITQYKAFANGTIGLDELSEECKEQFPEIFRGSIYYSSVVDSWKRDLVDVINKVRK